MDTFSLISVLTISKLVNFKDEFHRGAEMEISLHKMMIEGTVSRLFVTRSVGAELIFMVKASFWVSQIIVIFITFVNKSHVIISACQAVTAGETVLGRTSEG